MKNVCVFVCVCLLASRPASNKGKDAEKKKLLLFFSLFQRSGSFLHIEPRARTHVALQDTHTHKRS